MHIRYRFYKFEEIVKILDDKNPNLKYFDSVDKVESNETTIKKN